MEYLQKVNWYKEMEELFSVGDTNTDNKKDYLEYFQQKTPLDDVFFSAFPSELCKDFNDLEQISKFSGKKFTGKCGEILDLANNSSCGVDKDNLKKRKAVASEDVSHLAKKEHHNYIEKKRRKKINSELEQLKELNPYCRNASANKLSILHFTCEYIQNLQDSYKKLMESNKALKEKNDKVQVEIREFQKFMLQTEENPNNRPFVPNSGAPGVSTGHPQGNLPCPQPPIMNTPNTSQPPMYAQPALPDHSQLPPSYGAPSQAHHFPNYNMNTQFQQPLEQNPAFNSCQNLPEAQFHQPVSLQQQQQLKLQMTHHQQQQQLQQLQQRLHSSVPPSPAQPNPNNYQQTSQIVSPQQQKPKRTTWTFTQIPSH
jgi:hypothetical protein